MYTKLRIIEERNYSLLITILQELYIINTIGIRTDFVSEDRIKGSRQSLTNKLSEVLAEYTDYFLDILYAPAVIKPVDSIASYK